MYKHLCTICFLLLLKKLMPSRGLSQSIRMHEIVFIVFFRQRSTLKKHLHHHLGLADPPADKNLRTSVKDQNYHQQGTQSVWLHIPNR